MHRHTTVRSWGAIALGTCCFLGTLIVLFWHVRSAGDFTVNHVYILLALAVAYGAGHFTCDAFSEWTISGALRGVAFASLACVATVICVGLSGGRGAEVLHVQAEQAGNENAKRVSQERRILEAKEDRRIDREAYDRAQVAADAVAAEEAAECKGGDGRKCKGKGKASASAADKAAALYKRWEASDAKYWMEVARLGDFKPMQTANGNLRQLAKVYARLSSSTEDEAMATISDLLPYALALLAEFGSIVCFQHGFGRRTVIARRGTETEGSTETDPTRNRRRRKPRQPVETEKLTGTNVVRLPIEAKEKAETLAFVLAELRAGRCFPSQDALAARAGVVKSTISKWACEWEDAGLIRRMRIGGRHKMINAVSS
jgi:hypothetical protein